jgi:hypothetical protein
MDDDDDDDDDDHGVRVTCERCVNGQQKTTEHHTHPHAIRSEKHGRSGSVRQMCLLHYTTITPVCLSDQHNQVYT